MNDEITFIIQEEEVGLRLDTILTKRFTSYSRSYFQYLLEEGKVSLNGKEVKKRAIPKAGDEVSLTFILKKEMSVEPEAVPLDILYEDEAIIAINKPPGMVVHPAVGHRSGTLAQALLHHCGSLPTTDPLRPGIVHRLDKETSGLLLAAKTGKAQEKLSEDFAKRRMEKEYLAICVGNPGSGTVDRPLGRHPRHRQKMGIIEGGREALTRFETEGWDGHLSLVRLFPKTGRTHQIRVHMASKGTFILGDVLYGSTSVNKKYGTKRQLLHAVSLTFFHPLTLERMRIEAPLPEDMKDFLKRFS